MKPYILFLFFPYIVMMQGAICLAQDALDHQAKSFDLNAIQILTDKCRESL
jgi:hypothetical protein